MMHHVNGKGLQLQGNKGNGNHVRRLSMELVRTYENMRKLASANAVVVFSLSSCCMCHVVKSLLFGLGVGPTIVELDEEKNGKEMQAVLYGLVGDGEQPLPAVFVGGKFLGGVQTVMSSHINGTLVPLLKDAGALWL
ncbi:glutaredoxin-C9-like [Telopea speciosissima]|uniref:glutaredoxin-C9-like n=1 Tax=Telopea speciosissima TaxID=54955 RepID=UPI001CC5F0A5|nr:glutaredoxin-C9-like [Telopea speciosissima]